MPDTRAHQGVPSFNRFRVKGSPGAAPTLDGDIRFDTTQHNLVWGRNGAATIPGAGLVCKATGTSTNNSSSGSGSDFVHTVNCVVPANTLQSGSVLRTCFLTELVTGSAPPTLNLKLKAGTTVLAAQVAQTGMDPNITNGTNIVCYATYVTAAPGASVNTRSSVISPVDTFADPGGYMTTTNPTAIATNASQTFQLTSLFSAAGTGTTTLTVTAAWGELF